MPVIGSHGVLWSDDDLGIVGSHREDLCHGRQLNDAADLPSEFVSVNVAKQAEVGVYAVADFLLVGDSEMLAFVRFLYHAREIPHDVVIGSVAGKDAVEA